MSDERVERIEQRNILLESRTRIALRKLKIAEQCLSGATSGNVAHRMGQARHDLISAIRIIESAIEEDQQ